MEKYVISVDQSTQGTKALLLGRSGKLIMRTDLPHRQIVNDRGWVSHDLNEIYHNTIEAIRMLIENTGIMTEQIVAMGISNQRETTAMWDRKTGEPLAQAIVWQCGRAGEIVNQLQKEGHGQTVKKISGIPLSAYFPAAKMAWFLKSGGDTDENSGKNVGRYLQEGRLCLGTIDSWLVFKLTKEHAFKTDYSNASRTQLFDLKNLAWSEELCRIFNIPMECLAEVCDSDAIYGYTDMEGLFKKPVPICGVLGDSHAALFGQGCLEQGMVKATYGTGSSMMMNVGKTPVWSKHGVVSSLAWGRQGKVKYVLEGNLNYTGAVITWLKDNLGLIQSAKETEGLAFSANPQDTSYLVPAFTGLGAPYWEEHARASIIGMSRATGKAEIVKAALECIAYQITDLAEAMEQDTGMKIQELCVDGGPTKNAYLMQFQSDLLQGKVIVPEAEELSGIGAAYVAGLSAGLYREDELFEGNNSLVYNPTMGEELRTAKIEGWKRAVNSVIDSEKL